MHLVTVKSSTIYVAMGNKVEVFRSMDDVPPALRKPLIEHTNGANSATILIADRKGREEIARAIRGLESPVKSRLAASLARQQLAEQRAKHNRDWRPWTGVLVAGACGFLIWLFSK